MKASASGSREVLHLMSRNALIQLLLCLFIPGMGNGLAEDRWAVVAPGRVDDRISRELRELGARSHAEVRFFRSTAEAARHGPKLSIELREEKSPDSFLGALKRQPANATTEPTAEVAQEGYVLELFSKQSSAPNHIRITAATAAGFHHALLRVPDVLRIAPSNLPAEWIPSAKSTKAEKAGTAAVIADFPSFPERGIVEGFYGAPWSHQDRLDIIRFEGQHGMNTYYYAPKDDPYHRKLWREPYPAGEMARLKELVEAARSNFVDFCFAVSPGLSMVYSSQEDFSKLTSKLESVSNLGVSCFALFLDDVPQELENPADRASFKTLAAAHVDLINRLHRHLKSLSPANRLTVTPTTYTNEWGSRDYIRELGAGADPDVAIVWTGPEVVSPAIALAQAKDWGELLRRKPLIWDNYPVNDGIAWRLNLGPLRGRDANLPAAVRGLVSNPMNQARASMLALQTVADYLWDSSAYDPERSHRKAVAEQYDKDAPELLGLFLKTYGDYWWDENIFKPLFVEERRPFDPAEVGRRITQLESSLEALRKQARFERLVAELSPFAVKARDRLVKVRGDAAFRHLPDGKLQWREDHDVLLALRRSEPPKLDGDFAKWRDGPLYVLNRPTQIARGSRLWKGPSSFSARVALAWDESYLYVGLDVTDPDLYQPFSGRGIADGDAFTLTLETAFRKNFMSTRADGDEYRLFFSPGNFSGVEPSVFSDEDYLPPRPHPHDYNKEIKTAWKKTRRGYSGDLAIPASFFEGGRIFGGYEIGLSFGVQKAFPTSKAGEDVERIVLSSKADRLFPVRLDNPSSYQRLVLIDPRKP